MTQVNETMVKESEYGCRRTVSNVPAGITWCNARWWPVLAARTAAAALASVLAIAFAAPAGAQTSLVSNFSESTHATTESIGVDDDIAAQQFTTGSSTYVVTAVQVDVHSVNLSPTLNLRLCPRGDGNYPDTDSCLGTLSGPATIGTGAQTFQSTGDTITVAASTRYFLVAHVTGGSSVFLNLRTTFSNEQASDLGWSIADNLRRSNDDGATWTGDLTNSLKINIQGYDTTNPPSDNNPATGEPAITGTAAVGQTLTASKGTIADADSTTMADNGDPGYAYTYQWVRVDASDIESEISGATSSTYTLTAADVDHKIKVEVSFKDDADNDESRTSAAYPASGSVLPAIEIDNVSQTVAENVAGGFVTITVNRTNSTTRSTVDYATRDVVAAAGQDYTATSGTLTFESGDTLMTVSVPILDDNLYESSGGTQRFLLDLSNVSGAVIEGSPSAVVHIQDNDPVPSYSIDPVTVGEGDGTMTVTLSATVARDTPITLEYVSGTIGGTATRGTDYADFLSGGAMPEIVLASEATSATFDITIIDDSLDESDETIVMTWISSSPSYTATFTGTIEGRDATGMPGIDGTPQVGQTLTATAGNMADDDNLPTTTFPAGYSFQWVQVDGSTETDVGTDSHQYAPVTGDVGKTIKVEVRFTDGGGAEETLVSDATENVVAAPGDCPAGNDWCTTMTVGSVTVGSSTWYGFDTGFIGTHGSLDDTTIDYAGGYTVSRITNLETSGGSRFYLSFDAFVPRGSEFDIGVGRATAHAGTETSTTGNYESGYSTFPGWYVGQRVTVSINFAPIVTGAVVQGDRLVLTFSEDLDTGSEPATDAFTVTAAGTEVAVDDVDMSGMTVTLTLASAVTSGQTVTVAYTKPSMNPLQDESSSENEAPSFGAAKHAVTNNTGSASTDATLSGLKLTWDDSGTETDITLNPNFTTGGKSYTATVANAVDEITIAPTPNDSNADYDIFDGSDMELADADADTSNGFQVELDEGANTIKVKVIAEDEMTTDTYTVTVTRTEVITVGYDPVAYEVTENATSVTLTIKVTSPAAGAPRAFTLSVTTAAGSALSPGDYGGVSGQLINFNSGDSTRTHTITIVNDAFLENDENFQSTLSLSNGESVTVSPATATVTIEGRDATGKPGIDGTPQVGQTLTATAGNMADDDNLPTTTFPTGYSFQWVQVDGSTETDVGTDSHQYAPVTGDVGKTIKVEVRFTDGGGAEETLVSDATEAVVAAQESCATDRAGSDWCATMTVGTWTTTTATNSGYLHLTTGGGQFDDTSFDRGSYTVEVRGIFIQDTATDDDIRLYTYDIDPSGWVVRDVVFDFGGTDFTADAGSEQVVLGEQFNIWSRPANFSWIKGQKVTVSAEFPNIVPEFSDSTATRGFDETIGDIVVSTASNIGAVVTANDDDGDTLEYTLEGTDAAKFTIDSGTGQIKTKAGEKYDYESKTSYEVTVKADDKNGGTDTIKVTLNVNDQDEAPVAPAAPTVTATSGSTTSLDVTWTASDNTGRPAITNYDLRYREGNSGNWTNGPQDVTGTSSAISGLTAGTSYQVQVRATNAEGDGSWSPSGTGSTNTPGNSPATGNPTISGAAQVGMTLSASTSDIMDADGLVGATFAYQWIRVTEGGAETNVGTDSDSYTLATTDQGHHMKVQVTFTDDGSTEEMRTSGQTNLVLPALSSNCDAETIWCGVLTVGHHTIASDNVSDAGFGPGFGSLDDATFTHLGVNYTITSLHASFAATYPLSISTTPELPSDAVGNLTLHVQKYTGELRLPFSDAQFVSGPSGSAWVFYDALYVDPVDPLSDVPLLRSYGPRGSARLKNRTDVGTEVAVRLSATSNNPATGDPTISGAAQVGMTLTASTSDIMDADGLAGATFAYQWIRVTEGGAETNVGTNSSTYTLTSSDQGHHMKVKVTFTDDGSTEEMRTSGQTFLVMPALSSNCGTDTFWCGVLTVGHHPDNGSDEVGFGPGFGSLDVTTFTLRGVQYTITVLAASDDNGRPLFIQTTPDMPADAVGNVTLHIQKYSGELSLPFTNAEFFTGTSLWGWTPGVFLQPMGSLSDQPLLKPDGRKGADRLGGATDIGTKIAVRLSASQSSNSVATGQPAITGTPQVGQTLTASIGTINDADGLPAFPDDFTFQWVRVDADGASNPTDVGTDSASYTLTAADQGKQLKVEVSFTDSEGTREGPLTSEATGMVAQAQVEQAEDVEVSVWYVYFSKASYTATEGGASARVEARLSAPWKPDRNEALTVRLSGVQLQGGASAADYSGVPSSVTFQPRQTSVSFTVRAIDDSADDDGESIRFGFAAVRPFPEDLHVGRGPGIVTVHLRDNNGPRVVRVSFGARSYTAIEGGADATVAVRLSAAPGRTVTVPLTRTHNGVETEDYSGVPSSVTFGASETSKTFAVEATDDSVDDDLGSVTLGFGNLPEGVSAGSPSTTTVNLDDNDGSQVMRTVSFNTANSVTRSVREGGSYWLGVSLDQAADRQIILPLKASNLGGATSADYSGVPSNVKFQPGKRKSGVIVRGVEDAEEDPGEGFRVSFGTLPAGVKVNSRYSLATFTIVDNDGPPEISVSDASAQESTSETYLRFEVTLSEYAEHEVQVNFTTVDGTAKAGEDYRRRSGRLVFDEGDREKIVWVRIIDDDHDEGTETMTLVLSNPVGANLLKSTGVGRITNDDAMPQAFLARFGRSTAVEVIAQVEARIEAERPAGMNARVAGRRLGPGMERDVASGMMNQLVGVARSRTRAAEGGSAIAGPGGMNPGSIASHGVSGPYDVGPGSVTPYGASRPAGVTTTRTSRNAVSSTDWGGHLRRGIGVGDFLTGSSFELNRETGQGGLLSFWSRGARSRFDGRDGRVSLSGRTATAIAGADYRKGRLVAGMSLAHSRSQGAYKGVGPGELTTSVTGFYPWMGYRPTERITVWGVTGYGMGTLRLTPGGGDVMETGLSMAMAAAGMRGTLAIPAAGGFGLDFKTDAMWVATGNAGVLDSGGRLASTRAAVTRFRVGIEASGRYAFRHGLSLRPSLETGLRQDGGDAETGAGVDVAGGLILSIPSRGIKADLRIRTLLMHQERDYRDRGVLVSFSYDPSPSTPLGFKARLVPSWGGQTRSGAEALWNRNTMTASGGQSLASGAELNTELAYGLPVGSRLVGSPQIGIRTTATSRMYELGYRLALLRRGNVSFELGVVAQHRENYISGTSNPGVTGRFRTTW